MHSGLRAASTRKGARRARLRSRGSIRALVRCVALAREHALSRANGDLRSAAIFMVNSLLLTRGHEDS